MSLTARALVAPALHGPLEIQEVELEDIRSDEALVEIHAVGICHADVSCLNGILPAKFPNVFGHEGAGVVKKVGNQVEGGIQPGDTVLLSYNSCADCITCKQGRPGYCLQMLPLNFGGTRLDGSHTMRTKDGSPLYGNFFGQSSFSSLAVVNSRCLVKVSDKVPLDLYAPLGCGLQTGAGGILNALNVQAGGSVAIFGTGSVGMAAIMAAKIRKASIIIGIDTAKTRLVTAQKLGATHVLDGAAADIVDQIKTICGGNGVMYALDATGVPTVIERMIESLGVLGRAISIGAPSPGTRIEIDVLSHLTMGRHYIGCNQGDCVAQEMIPYLIDQHEHGNFPLEEFVRPYAIEDFAVALEDMKSGKVIKPVLIWRHSKSR